jgi:hypothetical protein
LYHPHFVVVLTGGGLFFFNDKKKGQMEVSQETLSVTRDHNAVGIHGDRLYTYNRLEHSLCFVDTVNGETGERHLPKRLEHMNVHSVAIFNDGWTYLASDFPATISALEPGWSCHSLPAVYLFMADRVHMRKDTSSNERVYALSQRGETHPPVLSCLEFGLMTSQRVLQQLKGFVCDLAAHMGSVFLLASLDGSIGLCEEVLVYDTKEGGEVKHQRTFDVLFAEHIATDNSGSIHAYHMHPKHAIQVHTLDGNTKTVSHCPPVAKCRNLFVSESGNTKWLVAKKSATGNEETILVSATSNRAKMTWDRKYHRQQQQQQQQSQI